MTFLYWLFGGLACFFAGYAAGTFGMRNEIEGRDEQLRALHKRNDELVTEVVALRPPVVHSIEPPRRPVGKPIPESLKVVRSNPRAT